MQPEILKLKSFPLGYGLCKGEALGAFVLGLTHGPLSPSTVHIAERTFYI